MRHLTAVYFTGTGNTRYITEYLCARLKSGYDCELLEVTKATAEQVVASDAILFAFPIYGSAPPIPMRNFVHRCGARLKGKEILIAETQYFYSGDGAASLGRTIEKYGGKIVGAEMFNMPNNLADCKIFAVKNGEEIQETLSRARRKADKFAARILKKKARLRGFGILSHGVGYFTQRAFWRKGESEKRRALKIDPARCVGCGMCAKNCPADNILLQNKKAKPLGSCVLCYRCVNLCPKQAISLVGSAPPEVQYRGPFDV